MLIDWFTVGAQTLNFVILVWLMKRFLYQPILNAIDAREKSIADELTRADTISQQAKQEKTSYESKNLEFDQRRDQLMTEATEAANSERQRQMEVAHQTAQALEKTQQQALQNNMKALHGSIRQAAQQALFTIAKNALRDLAAVDIESQMIAVFVSQLRDLNNDQKGVLQTALKSAPLTVRSSNSLTLDQQNSIATALKALLASEALDNHSPDKKRANNRHPLLFEQSTELIGGIELRSNGFKIGWSVADYLQSLEDSLAKPLREYISPANITDNKPAVLASATDTT